MTNEQLKVLLEQYSRIAEDAFIEVLDNFPGIEEEGKTVLGLRKIHYPKISRLCDLCNALREDVETLGRDE